jgi:hypothetical protein
MEQQTRRPTAKQIIGGLGIVVLLIIGGYTAEWTGFGEAIFTKETIHHQGSGTTVDVAQDPRRAKTLCDWLQLLIISAVLATGGFWFNRQQNERA